MFLPTHYKSVPNSLRKSAKVTTKVIPNYS